MIGQTDHADRGRNVMMVVVVDKVSVEDDVKYDWVHRDVMLIGVFCVQERIMKSFPVV